MFPLNSGFFALSAAGLWDGVGVWSVVKQESTSTMGTLTAPALCDPGQTTCSESNPDFRMG